MTNASTPTDRDLPDRDRLTTGLTVALRANGRIFERATVVERTPCRYASTCPSESVTYVLDADPPRALLCKYPAPYFNGDHGHRGGIDYEALVYRDVLRSLDVSTPEFLGSYTDPVSGRTWLLLEYLGECLRVDKAPDPDGMPRAAAWIGRFHEAARERVTDAANSGVRIYDADYYRGWSRRTALYAEGLHDRYPWLRGLCERFEGFVELLLEAPPTVIHGEYYPHNILLPAGRVCPVDWESAAIAPGEIDLAGLTEQWPQEITTRCEAAYRAARWPEGPSHDFERRLGIARIYILLRWLGDRPGWTLRKSSQARFVQLESLARQWGLL